MTYVFKTRVYEHRGFVIGYSVIESCKFSDRAHLSYHFKTIYMSKLFWAFLLLCFRINLLEGRALELGNWKLIY